VPATLTAFRLLHTFRAIRASWTALACGTHRPFPLGGPFDDDAPTVALLRAITGRPR
jgi:hypothetical protein